MTHFILTSVVCVCVCNCVVVMQNTIHIHMLYQHECSHILQNSLTKKIKEKKTRNTELTHTHTHSVKAQRPQHLPRLL
jgi:hypothetical protein